MCRCAQNVSACAAKFGAFVSRVARFNSKYDDDVIPAHSNSQYTGTIYVARYATRK